MDNSTALQVVQEVEILGRMIKMYGTIEFPYFVASDVAEWLGERDGYTVARKVSDEEKDTQIVCTLGGNQKTTVFTEDACMKHVCFHARKLQNH